MSKASSSLASPTSDQSDPAGKPSRKICFCHEVMEDEIRLAIRAGAKTLSEIQLETLASTGCGGCESEVMEILAEELKPA